MGQIDREDVQDELQRLARRIRRWREEAGFTLQELSRRSGVAAGTIQKVETVQMIPTVAVLLRIGRGLGRLPSELVRDDPAELESVLLRAKDRAAIGLGSRGNLDRITGDLFEPVLEAWRVELQPGASLNNGHLVRYEGEELVVCEAGHATIAVGNEVHHLESGDTLHFKATLPHGWRNSGDEVARFLVLGTVPRALRAALQTGRKTPGDESASET